MQQLSIKVRARSTIEAGNLGLTAARHYFLSLLWVSLPVWGAVVSLSTPIWLGFHSPSLAIIIVWWFKPLYERPALKHLSDLIFAQKTSYWQVQKAAFAKGWFAEITYKRLFAGNRIIRHAINLLEGVDKNERRERIKTCAFLGNALRWALVLPVFEMVLIYTIIAFMPGLPELPQAHQLLQPDLDVTEVVYWFYCLTALLFYVVSLFSTILFVSIGFMLYLNSRIVTEGWAIALDMQVLAQRLLSVGLALLCASFLFLGNIPQALAITQAEQAQDKQWVEDIVNDPELTPYTIKERRVSKPDNHDDTELLTSEPNDYLAQYVRLFLIVLLIIAILILVYLVLQRTNLRHRSGLRHNSGKQTTATQEVLHHQHAIDPLDKAIQHLHKGDIVSALAVIYTRLAGKPQQHQIKPFILGETETDYLLRTRALIAQSHYDFLQDLFDLWQRTAYGKQTIAPEVIHALINKYRAIWS